jgi:hypothetical protein
MREISRDPDGERKWPWVREFAYTSGAPRPKLVIEGSRRRFGADVPGVEIPAPGTGSPRMTQSIRSSSF